MFHTSLTHTVTAFLGAGVLVLAVSGVAGCGDVDAGTEPTVRQLTERKVPAEGTQLRQSIRVAERATRGCLFDPRYLPRTPDSVEGWYRSCLSPR